MSLQWTVHSSLVALARATSVAVGLLALRGGWWFVNMLWVLPQSDPLQYLPGPDGPVMKSMLPDVLECVEAVLDCLYSLIRTKPQSIKKPSNSQRLATEVWKDAEVPWIRPGMHDYYLRYILSLFLFSTIIAYSHSTFK